MLCLFLTLMCLPFYIASTFSQVYIQYVYFSFCPRIDLHNLVSTYIIVLLHVDNTFCGLFSIFSLVIFFDPVELRCTYIPTIKCILVCNTNCFLCFGETGLALHNGQLHLEQCPSGICMFKYHQFSVTAMCSKTTLHN